MVSSDARLHINPLHFLARSAVCPQMSCTSCLSNNNIQTPDQTSVPCTIPYFHKDTLTPPSSSRSPMHLYITHALYFEIYTKLLEVIQLMFIAGYEAYVCACFFLYKTLCAAFIWLPWDARSHLYVCLYYAKNYLIPKICLQKSTGTRTKNIFKNGQKVGMLL